ncbi:Replication protein A C terminal [Rhizoctonia solani]|uniref:Replication protein A C terminal n=1 Tax=Rhizoctonia solani TaxID=456999 RepID=A0A8H7ILN8_9AGAM|nr:Replication protein A C terminal [Rhizoctonia solani]
MPPIPVKQPKTAKPLPLEATLKDLSNMHSRNIDLSVLLDQPAQAVSLSDQSRINASVAEQGDRVEDVRAHYRKSRRVSHRAHVVYTSRHDAMIMYIYRFSRDKRDSASDLDAFMSYGGGGYYGDGGGFLSGSQVGGGSQGSPSGGKARNVNQSLRPVTIRQIYTAEQTHSDADYIIDNSETTQITLVAQVVAANKQATNITYKLNDGTAEIKAKHWLENSEEEPIGHGQNEHVYIRVVGTLKTFSGERQINALTRWQACVDPMEIYYHLIEAQLVHLHYTRRANIASGAVSAGAPAASAYQAGGKGCYLAETTLSFNTLYSGRSTIQVCKFPPLQRRILEVLEQLMPQHEQGVHVTTIANGLNVQASIDEIGATMEKLAEEGHIYATMDDEHFAIS